MSLTSSGDRINELISSNNITYVCRTMSDISEKNIDQRINVKRNRSDESYLGSNYYKRRNALANIYAFYN